MYWLVIYPFSNIWKRGDYYIGEFKEGLFHGEGEFHRTEGDVYKGQYENGKRSGNGTMIYANRTKKTGKWKDDKFIK